MRRLCSLALLVALVGCGSPAVEPPTSRVPAPSAPPLAVPSPHVLPAVAHPVVPKHFRLGSISAKVIPAALDGDSLVPPDDPRVLGWWGKKAGASSGVTLLTGHTVHDGGGTLDNLEDVKVGQRLTVSGVRYVVTSNRVISKDQLAKDAPRLFAQSGRHRLVVVTCEDYDVRTGHYRSNVVMVAEAV